MLDDGGGKGVAVSYDEEDKTMAMAACILSIRQRAERYDFDWTQPSCVMMMQSGHLKVGGSSGGLLGVAKGQLVFYGHFK